MRAGPASARRAWPIALVLAALAATGGAVTVIAVSRIAPDPLVQSLLTALVCLAYVGTGAYAVGQPPYARFGLLLAAVGFASLVSVLHEANAAPPYAVGVLLSNGVFAVLVHALLAFPSGRLGTRGRRALAAAAFVDVVALQVVASLFDPLTRYHSDHPRNLALVSSHPDLATALLELEAAIAAAIAVGAVVVLWREVRAASAPARRQLAPVLVGGAVALLCFAVGLVLAPVSSRAGFAGFGLGLLASLALPAAFVAVMVQGRLSRAAASDVLVELREPQGLEEGLRRALGDPSLALLRARPADGVLVDAAGRPADPPADAEGATPIVHGGERLGVLVHDRALGLRRSLLDAVCAAAGFALATERSLEQLERSEARNRALLDALPDVMFRLARDGTFLDVHAAPDALPGAVADGLVGANVRDVLGARAAAATLACVADALGTGEVRAVDYVTERDGRCFELRAVPSGPGEVVAIRRDVTERRRDEAARRRLAAEQAALRRVATLVAGDAPPEQVFQAVTEEACLLLGIRTAVLHRFEGGATSTIVGKFGEPTGPFELGRTNRLETGTALEILRTGASARADYSELDGGGAATLRRLGYRGGAGVPIGVGGATWGALVVALREDDALPPETERRLQDFAELVGLAVSSAHARNELNASRLRLVEASDAARRRIERNLHDGAQQRLVALAVRLRLAGGRLPDAPREAAELLDAAQEELAEALQELRELAQGIHPAVLTARGLPAALELLATRAPLPVAVDVRLPQRLPAPVEAAAYYVVSESLANVVKHARATTASVRVVPVDGRVLVEVADDGVGGAAIDGGSGLHGLRDRVETLGGRIDVASARGRGTTVRCTLPLT